MGNPVVKENLKLSPEEAWTQFHALLPSAETKVRTAVAGIIQRSQGFADVIEELNPGDTHGKSKLGHMERVARELEELKVRYSKILKSEEAIEAYMLASIGHDVGRMALRADQLKTSQRHLGALQAHGQRTIEEIANALNEVSPLTRFLTKAIVRWHDTRESPSFKQMAETLKGDFEAVGRSDALEDARALLGLFRDRDKINILQSGTNYFTPAYMFQELLNWQLGGEIRKACPWVDGARGHRTGLLRFVGFPASGEESQNQPITPKQLDEERGRAIFLIPQICKLPTVRESADRADFASGRNTFLTEEVLRTAIFGPPGRQSINPLTLEAAEAHQLGTKSQVTYSYGTYMLYAVQFLFGLELPDSVREVKDKRLLGIWLDYHKLNTEPEIYTRIERSVDEFMRAKLG